MLKFIDKFLHKKIGLALGGGGARGAAHIGALKALKERDVKVSCLSGTSGGAIIAALYAFDIPFDKMTSATRNLKSVDLRSLKLGALGLVANTPLNQLIDQMIGKDATIEQSSIPLAIHTTDIQTGEPVILTEGPLAPAVLASSCVPGFYIPQEIESRILVDGGLTENIPLSALRQLGANFTIAVNLNGNFAYSKPEGILDVASNAMDIAIDLRTKEQIENADLSINLNLQQYSRKSTDHIDQIIQEGWEQTQKQLTQHLGD